MKKKRSLHWLWWAACALWLSLIFLQSTMTAQESSAESGGLLSWLISFFPFLSEKLLRKLAHFGEFFVLGGLLAQSMRRTPSLPLLAGLLCAMCDETLQLFSEGRACMVQDVWIDFAGVTLAVLLTFTLRRILRRDKVA